MPKTGNDMLLVNSLEGISIRSRLRGLKSFIKNDQIYKELSFNYKTFRVCGHKDILFRAISFG